MKRVGCGTPAGYKRGCRCDPCREAKVLANRLYRAGVRSRTHPVPGSRADHLSMVAEWIRCGGCRQEIESCLGRDTDWMHTLTRSERCADGRLARPETAAEWTARKQRKEAS